MKRPFVVSDLCHGHLCAHITWRHYFEYLLCAEWIFLYCCNLRILCNNFIYALSIIYICESNNAEDTNLRIYFDIDMVVVCVYDYVWKSFKLNFKLCVEIFKQSTLQDDSLTNIQINHSKINDVIDESADRKKISHTFNLLDAIIVENRHGKCSNTLIEVNSARKARATFRLLVSIEALKKWENDRNLRVFHPISTLQHMNLYFKKN